MPLGPVAEAFIKGRGRFGMTKLVADLEKLAWLEAACGRDPLVVALERAVHFGRFWAGAVRSILAAGAGLPRPTRAGEATCRLTPELLLTAKTQRWFPDFLASQVEAEISSREASNARTRLAQAAFPVHKTLEEFDVGASPLKAATFDYLASLEWIAAKENLCLVGPTGLG